MSTNYYFEIETDCKFCETISIHIGKTSIGWEPVFEKTEYYESVEEIREFYEKNEKEVAIVDEYGEEMSFEELEERLIYWNKGNDEVLREWGRDGDYRDNEGYFFISGEFSW